MSAQLKMNKSEYKSRIRVVLVGSFEGQNLFGRKIRSIKYDGW